MRFCSKGHPPVPGARQCLVCYAEAHRSAARAYRRRKKLAGLCSQCGTNLNRGACACRRDWEDPRFAALRALKGNDRLKSH